MFTDEVLEVNYYNKYRVEPFIHASVQSYYQTKYKTNPTRLISPSFQPQHGSRIKQCDSCVEIFQELCKIMFVMNIMEFTLN